MLNIAMPFKRCTTDAAPAIQLLVQDVVDSLAWAWEQAPAYRQAARLCGKETLLRPAKIKRPISLLLERA